LFAALDHFRFHGHDVLIIQILDPLERRMPIGGAVRFEDLETGAELTTQADEIRRPTRRRSTDGWPTSRTAVASAKWTESF